MSSDAEDADLLARFTESGCQGAFEQLVERHLAWVSALVRRKIKDRHLAEDVTQAVFIVLSRKADTIRKNTPLAAWLFRVARFAVRDAVKHEQRRQLRWNRVAQLQNAWTHGISQEKPDSDPSIDLDDVIACLGESDRQAILLRFYEDMSMAEVGVALGISEVAAKKRVSRALKRLRTLLIRNGAEVGSLAVLITMLRGAKAAHAGVPSGHGVGAMIHGNAQASAQSIRLADSTLRSIAGAQSRVWSAMAGGALVAVMAIGIFSPAMGQGTILQDAKDALSRVFFDLSPNSLYEAMVAPKIQTTPQKTQTSVDKLWVGRASEKGWPILPLGGGGTPLALQSVSGSNDPVAIALDSHGDYWYRRVDPQSVSSLIGPIDMAQAYDLFPMPDGDSQFMPSNMIERGLEAFEAAQIMSAVDGNDWRPANSPNSGGTVVLNFAGTQISGGEDGLNTQVVPEPMALSSLAVFAMPLLLRRRRRD